MVHSGEDSVSSSVKHVSMSESLLTNTHVKDLGTTHETFATHSRQAFYFPSINLHLVKMKNWNSQASRLFNGIQAAQVSP
jgi:hypothetical protein